MALLMVNHAHLGPYMLLLWYMVKVVDINSACGTFTVKFYIYLTLKFPILIIAVELSPHIVGSMPDGGCIKICLTHMYNAITNKNG